MTDLDAIRARLEGWERIREMGFQEVFNSLSSTKVWHALRYETPAKQAIEDLRAVVDALDAIVEGGE